VRIFCGILDIPVHAKLTESLHVMFTLFSDFKARDQPRSRSEMRRALRAPLPAGAHPRCDLAGQRALPAADG